MNLEEYSEDELHHSELRSGYNDKIGKYFIDIIDIETAEFSRAYLDEIDFLLFAGQIIEMVKKKKNEKKR